jgi:xylobiose transport system permease protein
VVATAETESPPAPARARPRVPARPATSRPRAWYLLPAGLFFGIFAAFPLVLVVYLSFTDWAGIGDPVPNGVHNWVELFSSSRILEVTGTTLLLTVLAWATQTPLALLIGVWAAGPQRNRAILSSIFFLPLLLSSAAIALMWNRLLDPHYGAVSELGPLRDILNTGSGALGAIVFVLGWQYIPFHTLLYQASARNIPKVLYDAATVDGASRWHMFWHITLPQLRNTIITSSVIMVVGSLTYFETVLLLTNGGPGTSTYTLPFEMYIQGFRSYEFGYASAIATVLVVFATAISLVIVKVSGFAKMRSTLEGM